MTGLLDPTFKEVRLGVAEVRDIFKVPKFGTIAGCMVTEGRITRAGRHAGAAAARQRRRLRGQDRLAPPLQGRCERGQDRASSAASASTSSTTSRSATSSRCSRWSGSPSRRRRSSRKFASSDSVVACMSQGSRPDRVADQIRGELATLLAREVHDPGIGFVTLTRVQVTPDLQQARVYYTDARRREGARTNTRARARARGAVPAPPDRLAAAPEARARARRSSTTSRSPARIASSSSSTRSSAAGAATPTTTDDDVTRPELAQIVDAIRAAAAVRHLLARAAGRRLDRIAAGDGLRAARARQGRRRSSTPTRRRRR